jgi:pimeloyl-ACP methyl ester carboxylesterase
MLGFLALPPDVAARLTPNERVWVDQLVSTLFTVSLQKQGLINDNRNHVQRQRAALEQIKAPTLIVNAADDPFKTLPGAEYTAQHIQDVRFIRLEHGGHLLAGGQEEVWAESVRFLANAPTGAN